MAIQLKRAYDKPERTDGYRVLIDRIWPRGVRKEDLELDEWHKALAPSTELRQWFEHDPQKWEESRRRYFRELDSHPEEIQKLREKMREGPLTIVFGSKEERFNNATALKEYLERPAGGDRSPVPRRADRPTSRGRGALSDAARRGTGARTPPGRRSGPTRTGRSARAVRPGPSR